MAAAGPWVQARAGPFGPPAACLLMVLLPHLFCESHGSFGSVRNLSIVLHLCGVVGGGQRVCGGQCRHGLRLTEWHCLHDPTRWSIEAEQTLLSPRR